MEEGSRERSVGATNGEERVTKSGVRGKWEETVERKWGEKEGGQGRRAAMAAEEEEDGSAKSKGETGRRRRRGLSFSSLFPSSLPLPLSARHPDRAGNWTRTRLSPSLSFLFLFLCLARPPWLRSSAGALGPRNS